MAQLTAISISENTLRFLAGGVWIEVPLRVIIAANHFGVATEITLMGDSLIILQLDGAAFDQLQSALAVRSEAA